MRLHDLLDYCAREQPDAEFAVQGARRLTYSDALTAANQLANALIDAGLQPVTGWRSSRNRIEYVVLYLPQRRPGLRSCP